MNLGFIMLALSHIGILLNACLISGVECEHGIYSQDLENITIQKSIAYEENIWLSMRDGFRFPHDPTIHPSVQKYIDYYSNNPYFLQISTKRAAPYIYYITEALKKENMPLEIALIPFIESAYDPFAFSPSLASGLWQFIPSTGRSFDLSQDWWFDGRRDVIHSTDAALTYLKRLHKRFDDDWLLAIAAYNLGSYNLKKAIGRNRALGKPTDFWHLKLPRETTQYIPKLLALKHILMHFEKYRNHFHIVENAPYFTVVELSKQIDLGQVSQLSGVSIDDIRYLNPAINRWTTPPSGPFRILLPNYSLNKFRMQLASLPASQRIAWDRHQVRSGETLSHLAARYNLSSALIKRINYLSSNIIHPGQKLVIPSKAIENVPDEYFISLFPEKAKSKTYSVAYGDNLSVIAQKLKVKLKDIIRLNNIDKNSVLHVGQKLKIPHSALSAHAKQKTRRVIYTIRKGDSLGKIASKFEVTVNNLLAWNKLSSSLIHPGRKISIIVNIP